MAGASAKRLKALRKKYHLGEFSRKKRRKTGRKVKRRRKQAVPRGKGLFPML